MAATRIIVLLTLKPGKNKDDYENWARSTDLPTVNSLQSIDTFTVFEATGLLGAEGHAPYDYIEMLDIADMAQFGIDVSGATMQRVAAEFQDWCDPIFITTRDIGK